MAIATSARTVGAWLRLIPQLPPTSSRIFHLYAYENLTLDGVVERINAEGMVFRPSQPKFPRSSIHNILKDRAYIGEILHQGRVVSRQA